MSGLIGFELSVFNKLYYKNIAIVFGGDGKLGWYLKALGKRVSSNDLLQSTTWKAIANIENNGFILSSSAVEVLTTAATNYAELGELQNSALLDWFGFPEACWLEGFREAVLDLQDRQLQSLAFTLGQQLGDYWLSFNNKSSDLRCNASFLIPRLLSHLSISIDNKLDNKVTNVDAHQFVTQISADLLYAHFPSATPLLEMKNTHLGWKEIWITGKANIWENLTISQRAKFGGFLQTKRNFTDAIVELLKRAKHIPQWVLSIKTSNNVITIDELTEIVMEFRPIQKIYTKNTSELFPDHTQHILITKKYKK